MSTISISDRAAERIEAMMAKDASVIGLRLGTTKYGCSGLGYTIDLVTEANPDDEIVEDKGCKLYVDRKSLIVLMGTSIDWEDSKFATGFTFSNPNETGRCGCGESFTV